MKNKILRDIKEGNFLTIKQIAKKNKISFDDAVDIIRELRETKKIISMKDEYRSRRKIILKELFEENIYMSYDIIEKRMNLKPSSVNKLLRDNNIYINKHNSKIKDAVLNELKTNNNIDGVKLSKKLNISYSLCLRFRNELIKDGKLKQKPPIKELVFDLMKTKTTSEIAKILNVDITMVSRAKNKLKKKTS